MAHKEFLLYLLTLTSLMENHSHEPRSVTLPVTKPPEQLKRHGAQLTDAVTLTSHEWRVT